MWVCGCFLPVFPVSGHGCACPTSPPSQPLAASTSAQTPFPSTMRSATVGLSGPADPRAQRRESGEDAVHTAAASPRDVLLRLEHDFEDIVEVGGTE